MARYTRAVIRPKSAAASGAKSPNESTCARLASHTVPGSAHSDGGRSVQVDRTGSRTWPVQMRHAGLSRSPTRGGSGTTWGGGLADGQRLGVGHGHRLHSRADYDVGA